MIYLDIKNDPAYDDINCDAQSMQETGSSSSSGTSSASYGTKYGAKCNSPYSSFDCYDLSDGAVCPSGFHSVIGSCPGSSDIKCCIK
jgi:hypothetical protein